MAATSDLERLQCIALAVRAAAIPEGMPLVKVEPGVPEPTIKPPSDGQTRESVLFVARKPMTQADLTACFTAQATGTMSAKEVFFYELFNFYRLAQPLSFWASTSYDLVVNLPKQTRLTRALLEYIPKEYFVAGNPALRKAQTERNRLAKKIEGLEAEVQTKRSYLDVGDKDPKDIADLVQETRRLQRVMNRLQTQIDAFGGFFRRGPVPQPVQAVIKPFVAANFKAAPVLHPASTYAVALAASAPVLTLHPSLQKVWKVTKNCDKLLAGKDLSRYRFMDQNSAFLRTVKDDALLSLIDNFGLRGIINPQILSPVDIFIVHADAMEKIKTQLKDTIAQHRAPSKGGASAKAAWRARQGLFRRLRGRSGEAPTSYAQIMRQHFEDRTCLGISLKLPETVQSAPVMKIVGAYRFAPSNTLAAADADALALAQDPFTQLLERLEANPAQLDTLIDQVVTIEFKDFDIRRNIRSWTYPVVFNYDALFPTLKQRLGRATLNVRFNLMTWDKAGFNGQWAAAQPDPSFVPPSNWTGGFAMKPANFVFRQYVEYNTTILPALVRHRVEAFNTLIRQILKVERLWGPQQARDPMFNGSGTPNFQDWNNARAFRTIPNFRTIFGEALRAVKRPQIIGLLNDNDSAPLLRFFRLLDGEEFRRLDEDFKALDAKLPAKLKATKPPATPLSREEETQRLAYLALKKERDNSLKRANVRDKALQYYEIYRAMVIERLVGELNPTLSTQWSDYVRNYWTMEVKDRGGKGDSPVPNITAHYVAAQFAYFLFHAGPTAHLTLKRKIFLTVFGLITKSGYKTFQSFTGPDKALHLQNLFEARVEMLEKQDKRATQNTREEVFTYTAAPYVIFS